MILCDGDECEKDPDHTSTTYIYFTGITDLTVPGGGVHDFFVNVPLRVNAILRLNEIMQMYFSLC